MAAKLSNKEIVEKLSQTVADIQLLWPHFDAAFILHKRGQKQDEIDRLLAGLSGHHPCYQAARDLLYAKNTKQQSSGLIGVAIGHERKMFGLKTQSKFLSLISLNVDSYSDMQNCLADAYHFLAHAIDTMNLVESKHLGAASENIILQPKRNQLGLARINLKSDVFSALMMSGNGFPNASQNLGFERSMKSLLPQSTYRPEEYPFPIAMDVLDYAMSSAKEEMKAFSAYNLAGKITGSFEKSHLLSWSQFTGPAQIMAWNEEKPEDILGTAVYTSSDPLVKATANLVSEVTGITPATVNTTQAKHNPYADEQFNRLNHLRLAEETFELAVISALEAESNLPLIQIANRQNEDLMKGKVLGWCAHALHGAAKAFDFNLKSGVPFAQAAAVAFQGMVAEPDWNSMQSLNGFVLAQRRNGYAVNLKDLTDWCKTRSDMRTVVEAVNLTLADPDYKSRLAAANDLPTPGPRPVMSGPQLAPQGPAPSVAPRMGMAAPGMGGSMGGMGGTVATPPVYTKPVPVQIAEDE